MEAILLIYIISAFVCGWAATKLSDAKGGHTLGWFCIGFALNVLGVAILVASPYNQEKMDRQGVKDSIRKYCPYCSEIIRRAAVKCRYCASDIEGEALDKIT